MGYDNLPEFDYRNGETGNTNSFGDLYMLYISDVENFIQNHKDDTTLHEYALTLPMPITHISIADIIHLVPQDITNKFIKLINDMNTLQYDDTLTFLTFLHLTNGIIKLEPIGEIYIDIDVYGITNIPAKTITTKFILEYLKTQIPELNNANTKFYITPSGNIRIVYKTNFQLDMKQYLEYMKERITNYTDYIYFHLKPFKQLLRFAKQTEEAFKGYKYEYFDVAQELKQKIADKLKRLFVIPVHQNSTDVIIAIDYVYNFRGEYFVENVLQPIKDFVGYHLTPAEEFFSEFENTTENSKQVKNEIPTILLRYIDFENKIPYIRKIKYFQGDKINEELQMIPENKKLVINSLCNTKEINYETLRLIKLLISS